MPSNSLVGKKSQGNHCSGLGHDKLGMTFQLTLALFGKEREVSGHHKKDNSGLLSLYSLRQC